MPYQNDKKTAAKEAEFDTIEFEHSEVSDIITKDFAFFEENQFAPKDKDAKKHKAALETFFKKITWV